MYIARVSVTGADGLRFYLPAAGKPELIRRLGAAGAVPADTDDVRTVRIENARPRFGDDLTGDYIPHETQVLRAVSFNKGCYLGQEIVERVRSRGHVNKLLVPLRLNSQTPPASGAKLTADGKDAGVITSAALSPALGAVVALGYVRAAFAKEGQKLEVDGGEAEVTGPAPR
jgi:folate-binding protein YgfZ